MLNYSIRQFLWKISCVLQRVYYVLSKLAVYYESVFFLMQIRNRCLQSCWTLISKISWCRTVEQVACTIFSPNFWSPSVVHLEHRKQDIVYEC
jgi:hypothetical protein